MRIIDSDAYYLHGIECIKFPGGELHVKVPQFSKDEFLLHLKLRDWDSVGFAALLQDALIRQGHSPISFIPYFPGARQDRSDGTAAVTVEVMGRLLGRGQLITFDPHSRATTHAYPSITYMMPADLQLMRTQSDVVGIIAPDAGALTRARLFRDRFYGEAQTVISCTKTRDSQTGRLSNYMLPPLTWHGRYIVVDDICDGGWTFNLLAEAFRKDPIGKDSKLELFVSHGIFSKGLDAIDPIFEHITTTDSWCCMPNSERLTVIPLLPALLSNLERYCDI